VYNVPRTPQAPVSPPPSAAPPSYGPPPRRYPGLRFVASTCVVSAWITLVLSVIGGIMMMAGGGLSAAAHAPSLMPSTGGEGGAGGAAPNPGAEMARLVLGGLQFAGGVMTLVTGVGGFLLLLAVGLIIYVILDMEESTRVAAQAMSAIARRMGMSP